MIVPSSHEEHVVALASRLAQRLDEVELDLAGKITVSIGVAEGPEHATNPRELVACAEAAMMTAKARGKNQVVFFDDTRPSGPPRVTPRRGHPLDRAPQDAPALAGKLNRSNDVREIGMAIANELRQLIDYHNCRVFVVEGEELAPIAFRGELTAPDRTAAEVFRQSVGEGFTGRVVETGEPLLLADASKCEFAITIEGTTHIDESIIAVPLKYGTRGDRRDRRLQARPRPVRRGRRAPARGARRPRGGRARERAASTRRSGARPRARRRCSSSDATSPPRRASTTCSRASSRAPRS